MNERLACKLAFGIGLTVSCQTTDIRVHDASVNSFDLDAGAGMGGSGGGDRDGPDASMVRTDARKDAATDLRAVDRPADRRPPTDAIPPGGGLVLHWAFDEGSGTVANDSSGNDLNGTLKVKGGQQLPSWVPGKKGSALEFNRTIDTDPNYPTQWVELPHSQTKGLLDVGADEDLTISVWVNREGNSDGDHMTFLSKDGNITATNTALINPGFSIHLLNDAYDYSLSRYASDATQWVATEVTKPSRTAETRLLPMPGWHHIVSVFDRQSLENCRWYIDGQDVTVRHIELYDKQGSRRPTTRLPAGDLANTLPFVVAIGPYRSGDAPFNGMIDEVRIYKRALSASEIQWLYTNP